MLDVLLGSENVNRIERELANIINDSISNNDTDAFSQQRGNFSQENLIADFSGEKTIPRHDRLVVSMKYSHMTLICVSYKKWTH